MLTQEELHKTLAYDACTGLFVWKVPKARAPVGSIAGGLDRKGYVRIQINRRRYQAHRLAWLWTTGEWPIGEVDHIDGQKSNNALSNLRVITSAQNHQNIRRPRSDNTIGLLGVGRNGNRYRAQIKVDGRSIYLGSFVDPAEAHQAYLKAKREMHEFSTL